MDGPFPFASPDEADAHPRFALLPLETVARALHSALVGCHTGPDGCDPEEHREDARSLVVELTRKANGWA